MVFASLFFFCPANTNCCNRSNIDCVVPILICAKKNKNKKKYHSTIMLPLILASYFSCPQKMWDVSEHHTIHANVLDAACAAKGFLHTTKSAQKHSIPLFLSHHRKERLYTREHNFISACDSLFGPFILIFLRMRCEGSGMFVVRMFLLFVVFACFL